MILAVIAFILFRLFFRGGSFGRWGRKNSGESTWDSEPHSTPAQPQSGGWDSGQPVDFEGRPIRNERSRFGAAINYTRQNMDYYAGKFPRWDYGVLTGRVKQVFFYLQDAWSRQDISECSEYLTADLMAEYEGKLDAIKARGERNIVRDPDLSSENIDFVYSHLDADGERFVARIFASVVDYTVDASGKVIAGEEDNRLYFNEFWEFVWQDGQWKLAAIYQEDSIEAARWARVDITK